MKFEYHDLLPFARNDEDKKCLHMLSEGHTQMEVSSLMGVSKRTVERRLKAIREIAAMRGWSPEHDMVKTSPEGYVVKGTSTLYDGKGDQRLQWVKTSKTHDEIIDTLRSAVEGMKEDIPKTEPVDTPLATTNHDLLNLHVISDYHFGMMSWGEETGTDWDTSIAEREFLKWMRYSITNAPNAHTGILCNIGDFLHTDGMLPQTPASGHLLDTDSRFDKIVRTVIRCIRAVVKMMLEKYDHVHMINASGNHDESSAVWLREMFDAMYEDEPRMTVDTNPDLFYAYEHGDTSLFFHHGHKKRMNGVDSVFASKYRQMYGRTKHSYCHMGHLHHIDMKETNLMVVEQHRTFAPADSYASSHGYTSGRSAPVITYHKFYGEVSRLTVTPEMIQ